MKKTLVLLFALVFTSLAFTSMKITSNPNCPTGKTGAPSLSTGSVSNCTSCHGGNTLNSAGGGIVINGLPSTYVPGTAYPFSIKINHSAANRAVWGFAIKAIDTVTRAVVGTWTTTNGNTSIKNTPTNTSGNYELSHAQAATTTAANTFTYTNLTWTAPSLPTANQSRIKFYVSAVAGDGSLDETGDFVYTTTFSSTQYVAPTPCTFTYGAWTTCSNGTQTRTYTTSPAGCTGTPPADSITRTCSVPCTFTYGTWSTCSNGTQTRTYTTSPAGCTGVPPTDSITRTCTSPTTLPNAVTITATDVPGVCDTLKTFSVPLQSGVNYAWTVAGTGNSIINGQSTNSITVITKVAGTVYVTLSNSAGSIPSVSSAFTRKLPPTASSITGTLSPCSSSISTYTASIPVPSATQVASVGCRWTLPLNSRITTANADSTIVTVSFNSNFNGGSLSVKTITACGIYGAAKSITLSPAKAVDIVSSTGFWNGCIGNTVNYSVVTPVGTPIDIYRWTIPAFTTITSANADSSYISLQFNTGYKGGLLKVQSSTSCGNLGTATSKTLTHVGCAAGQRVGVEILETDLVNLYPNPNVGQFTLNVQTGELTTQDVLIQVYNTQGKIVYENKTQMSNGILSKNIKLNTGRGMYMVSYIIGNKRKTIKMYVTN